MAVIEQIVGGARDRGEIDMRTVIGWRIVVVAAWRLSACENGLQFVEV